MCRISNFGDIVATISLCVAAEEEDSGGERLGLWQGLIQWFPRRGKQLLLKELELSVYWIYFSIIYLLFAAQVLINLSDTSQLDNIPRWIPLKEQSEGDHHRRSHSGQGRHGSSKPSSQHSSPKTTASVHDNQESPKSSVTKSRSHGIFPDPAKGRKK